MEQLGFHWTDFDEIWYSSIFRKSVESIFLQNLTRIPSTLREDMCTFMIISRSVLRVKSVVEKLYRKLKQAFYVE